MPVISIRTDGALKDISHSLSSAPQWTPKKMQRTLRQLGPIAVRRMRSAVEPNRYTGALEKSIQADYSEGGMKVEIGPTAKRGKWDAGLILELGTRPITRLPWTPIKAWSFFRGIPAFPVWYKIRTEGVDAHPFLERTAQSFVSDVEAAISKLADEVARAALYGGDT